MSRISSRADGFTPEEIQAATEAYKARKAARTAPPAGDGEGAPPEEAPSAPEAPNKQDAEETVRAVEDRRDRRDALEDPSEPENAPCLKTIESASELQEDANDTNPYGMNAAFLYKNDPEKLAIETPIPFLQHPAQPKNLEIEAMCEARTAGVMLYYPLSALIIPGV